MVVGSNLYNLGQFIYHFLAGRLLGKVAYGDVAVMVSILGFVSVLQLAMGLTVVKFVASQKGKAAISNLVKWVNQWSVLLGVFVALLAVVLSPFLVGFLKITQPTAFYLLIPALFFFVMANNGRSILQGLLLFDKYVLSLLVEIAVKVVLTVILILAGFAVFGAVGAILVAIVASYLVTRVYLSPYLQGKRGDRPQIAPLIKYSLPVFIQGLALTSMYSADLILVKHFFSPEEAGIYASTAILGRVVFFSASPIIHVMFPLVSKRYSHGLPYHKIFYLSVLTVGALASLAVLFYFFFPEIAINILYGAGFLAGAPLLWWFGIFMGLLALSMLFIQFYLSIGKTKIVSLFAAAAIIQVTLIWFIHPNLLTVIQISIVTTALLLIGLLVYFPYHHRRLR